MCYGNITDQINKLIEISGHEYGINRKWWVRWLLPAKMVSKFDNMSLLFRYQLRVSHYDLKAAFGGCHFFKRFKASFKVKGMYYKLIRIPNIKQGGWGVTLITVSTMQNSSYDAGNIGTFEKDMIVTNLKIDARKLQRNIDELMDIEKWGHIGDDAAYRRCWLQQ